jgi:guanine nucleotide-binding protein subunit alpha
MCFGKKPEDPESRRNEEIEKSIRNDRRKQEREVKLLLLGMHPNRDHKAMRADQM